MNAPGDGLQERRCGDRILDTAQVVLTRPELEAFDYQWRSAR